MAERRVLICDDEVAFAQFVERVARQSGLSARAITAPDQFSPAVIDFKPTHIILDLRMPQVDGIQLIKRLAEVQSKARLFICSGSDVRVVEAAERLASELGLEVMGTIPKPVRAEELKAIFAGIAEGEHWLTEKVLRTAIEEKQLFLSFQPIISLSTRAIEGFEGLLRWQHPTRGVVMPMDFIPYAETAGLMRLVTACALELGAAQLKEWINSQYQFSISLNVSGSNLNEVDFPDMVASLCARSGVPTERIVLEITESAAMSDPIRAIEIMTRLRLIGVGLSIDDFGTGYSSLYQLHRLPFSEVKIDRAFVTDCHRSRQSHAVVRSIVGLATSLEVRCVAEGVENAEVLDILSKAGCSQAQGYYISRPIQPAQISGWAARWQQGNGPSGLSVVEPGAAGTSNSSRAG
jgi:EAL domain-containing protein (putative c-di-GMP-specific phosphodiesterase class I)/ActR/RegA family two-component response regulator